MAGKRKLDNKMWNEMQLWESTLRKPDKDCIYGDKAFIGTKYKYIGNHAFEGKAKIRSIVFPPECMIIGDYAFHECGLDNDLILPEKLQAVKQSAFEHNAHLKSVTLPGNLRIMEQRAFKECYTMKNVWFQEPCHCKRIHAKTFDSCKALEEIHIPDSVLRIEGRAFYRCKSLKTVVFPKNLKYIGTEAFYFNAMDRLDLPQALEEIGEASFFKCNGLVEVRIPKSVRRIGKWAFHGCNRLKVVEILHDPELIGEWIINRSALIRCVAGSKVDAYCKEYGFQTEYVEQSGKTVKIG